MEASGTRFRLLRSTGARQGMVMAAAMILAGALDYAVNVVAGRWLDPVDFGVFVSVSAVLQIVLSVSIAIRMVVAFYIAELTARGESQAHVAAFVHRAWRWSWRWGLVATAVMAAASPLLARPLKLPNVWPLWAASLMVLMLFLREAAYGMLQGTQEFEGLGLVQITQAALRLVLAAAFIWAGGRASGAIAAQPIGCIGALAVALWWLRPRLRARADVAERPVSLSYSVSTLAGLGLFGLMTNVDALFVKRFFSPRLAGDYGTVVTFEKISLFLPWAIGLVLFPKVTQRMATGRDPRPLLLLALAAALAPGLGVTALYSVVPGRLVQTVFTRSYGDPGIVLGLASLAATLFAGVHIWINYALSIGRTRYIQALVVVVAIQVGGMLLFGRHSLTAMALVMVCAGLLGNVGGLVATWSAAPALDVEAITIRAAEGSPPSAAGA